MTKSELREIIKGTIRQIKENSPAVAPARPRTRPDIYTPEIEPEEEEEENPFEPMDPDALPDENPKAYSNETQKENIKRIINRLKAGR